MGKDCMLRLESALVLQVGTRLSSVRVESVACPRFLELPGVTQSQEKVRACQARRVGHHCHVNSCRCFLLNHYAGSAHGSLRLVRRPAGARVAGKGGVQCKRCALLAYLVVGGVFLNVLECQPRLNM